MTTHHMVEATSMARNFCETMTWTGTNEKGLIQRLQIYLHFDLQIYKILCLLNSVVSTVAQTKVGMAIWWPRERICGRELNPNRYSMIGLLSVLKLLNA